MKRAVVKRETKETTVEIELELNKADGVISVDSGIGFLDHMLNTLAKHASWGLVLKCKGDLYIDDHHSVEDIGITLGKAFKEALGPPAAIQRFASVFCPLDESVARCILDISGRPFSLINLDLTRHEIGSLSTEMIPHFFSSFASSAYITIHLDIIRGSNDHHK